MYREVIYVVNSLGVVLDTFVEDFQKYEKYVFCVDLQTYDINICDVKQPLLLSRLKKREIRARQGDDSPLMLIPELCTRTG